jgi:methionyl-tRNA formyltransferase
MNLVRIAVLAAGEKGRAFLAGLLDNSFSIVVEVRTYAQSGTLDDADALIEDLCKAGGVRFHRGAKGVVQIGVDVDLIFVVGWQYLLPPDPRMVAFHDSLLPRFRGFSPTVTALIVGEAEVGVTALRPAGEPDAGPILAQHAMRVAYPAKIRDVLQQ